MSITQDGMPESAQESRSAQFALTDQPVAIYKPYYHSAVTQWKPVRMFVNWDRRWAGGRWSDWKLRVSLSGPNVKKDGTEGVRRVSIPMRLEDLDEDLREVVEGTRPVGSITS